ncbi:group III truncated hemoglobin [Cryomorpha ignava]|uniref:Group III truncated hemoglobin n=2 Tax=Cryomorpha ignava TaxID=101383 RepID=A0A7K3WMA5_9FLAO|nr:group III truncated hemoglobin [Cryomorpha ignava]
MQVKTAGTVIVSPKDILQLEDVKKLVDAFYAKIQADEKLGDIFNSVIQNRWPEHLEKMVRFWQTILLGEHTYYGSPFKPHASLPLEVEHFNQWLHLFYETIDANFEGEKAEEAKWRSKKMAEMFRFKLEHYRDNPSKTLL